MMQRLITQQAVDQKGARYITDALWMLMEHNIEEVKVLQTVTLLLTTNTVVHGDTLAKSLVLCFRLHYTKNITIVNTAGATIRQLVSLVFERVNLERELNKNHVEIATENSETPPPPKEELQTFAQDAYMLFQDLVQLVNADQPFWLIGMTEMTRTFGLELLEAVLTTFSPIFFENEKFTLLLKDRSCEEAIARLNQATGNPQTPVFYTVNQILYPLYQGCETKDLKIIKFCLGMMQRLITQQAVDQKGARYITDALWMLMEHNIEEVKVLQTVTLLLTTNTVVHGDTLAKSLVLCFRLHYTKNITIVNTAGATIRQLVSLVFERVNLERELNKNHVEIATENSETPPPPKEELQTFAQDAYMLFQDLVQLVNADQPFWLIGMTEMTRTFGL
uniref:Mon2/Sec7/BIG1-like dimerisation and cyclophilin-binding domain-containing protein n=1 Tax=Megaselia scalaris TaxID=36166 RepID=T1GWJ8_MEGSC